MRVSYARAQPLFFAPEWLCSRAFCAAFAHFPPPTKAPKPITAMPPHPPTDNPGRATNQAERARRGARGVDACTGAPGAATVVISYRRRRRVDHDHQPRPRGEEEEAQPVQRWVQHPEPSPAERRTESRAYDTVPGAANGASRPTRCHGSRAKLRRRARVRPSNEARREARWQGR